MALQESSRMNGKSLTSTRREADSQHSWSLSKMKTRRKATGSIPHIGLNGTRLVYYSPIGRELALIRLDRYRVHESIPLIIEKMRQYRC